MLELRRRSTGATAVLVAVAAAIQALAVGVLVPSSHVIPFWARAIPRAGGAGLT